MEQINFLENPNGPTDLPRAMAAGAGLSAQVWVRFLQSQSQLTATELSVNQ